MLIPLLSLLAHYVRLLFFFTILIIFQARADNTLTGDSKCVSLMCISATVNQSTVEYALQSTGSSTLGWMAMGFGDIMANSPMVIMWPNSDSSITLSQRSASGEVMPTVVSNPPRVATVSTALSTTSGTNPTLVFTIAANSDTQQNVIWAFGTTAPSSSAVDATLEQHKDSGTFTLDLTKTTTTSSNSTTITPSSSGTGSSGTSSSATSLTSVQKMIVAHGILSALGFLLFLPTGVLVARYTRTLTTTWFVAHWVVQLLIAGPIIITGAALGFRAVAITGGVHLQDNHMKWGLAIFVLYFAQAAFGAAIHWFKPRNFTGRPLQNYLHAVIGLLTIALAFYQTRTGYRTEWPLLVGLGNISNAVSIVWYVWVVLLAVLYLVGLSLLPRQFRQEGGAKSWSQEDMRRET
jgi:hypothetical protein